jgi:hypothetical protein
MLVGRPDGDRAPGRWGADPDAAGASAAYNGVMISIRHGPSPAETSIADVFLGRLAARDIDGLAELFELDGTLLALLPDGFHTWEGRSRIAAAFSRWFGRVDELDLLDSGAGGHGPRLHLRWRARVRGGGFGDTSYVVEQLVYADPGPTGRIQTMSMLCSGFVRETG